LGRGVLHLDAKRCIEEQALISLCFRNKPKKKEFRAGTPELRVFSFLLIGKPILSGEA